ncbi:MAG: signal peptidase II [Actinobacteria bacterium]|nr:signal peptidase II [Actinomycetota bacterium]
MKKTLSKIILNTVFILTTAAILAADQLTKYWVNSLSGDSLPITIIPGFISIIRITNTGAAFGMLQGWTKVFIIISVIATILIVILKIKLDLKTLIYNISLGFVLGGALGNLVDRIIMGEVTDFISVNYFAVFNVADSFIVIGFFIIIIILIRSFIRKDLEKIITNADRK